MLYAVPKNATPELRAVDLFAGAGGFTTGAEMAGVRVVWAANHWQEAVRIHLANHPGTEHSCQDLHQANWEEVPKHDLLLASPACQGFSKARGRERSYHDALRSTAWAVVSCAEAKMPRHIIVENVQEFLSWRLYPAWKAALQALGYRMTENILNAADFGVPQNRVRLFLVASLEKDAPSIFHPNLRHIPARGFLRLSEGNFSPVLSPGRAESTIRQWRRGRELHGEAFLLAYYGSEKNGRSLDRPLGTLTTRDRFAVVVGDVMRMLSVDEAKDAMGFPASYALPESRSAAIKMLGNAVCPPVAAEVIRQALGW